ncbi:MAG: hypothetical protein KTR25_07935 [Myxococcales bacterium]|nr:hypothetical protein [Myxococcales bacterium]
MLLKNPDWVTIKQLIKELQTFEDQEMIVEISVDGGGTTNQSVLFANWVLFVRL